MVVLMRLANGQGKCDRRCYDANEDRCTCRVCGGVLHGIGQDKALTMRTRLLRVLDQEIQHGEAVPHTVDETKRRQKVTVIVVERRVDRKVLRRLRAPGRVMAQIRAGQLPLWQGADRPEPLLPLARPRQTS